MKRVLELLYEARSEIIGGLVVAAVLAIVSWLGTLYASVGVKPFLIGSLAVLWVGLLGYVIYRVSRHRQNLVRSNNNDLSTALPSRPSQTQADGREISPYHPCFISYAHEDEEFVRKLYTDLQSKGVRCWFAPEDMKIGSRIRQTLDQSIQSHDKLLLILSEHSIDSEWVEKEVETAFEKERRDKQLVLFPICLDSAVMKTVRAWAADIRRMRYVGDFTQWKQDKHYERAFDRLLRDLRTVE
jgi:hypothetical protein